MMAKPLFLFAHGAGAPSTSTWMQEFAEKLSVLGKVVVFDYPYMAAGKRLPDRLPKLIEHHRGELNEARQHHRGPVVLIGKSMGGRVGCHVSLEEQVDAVVCLGYPLCAMGNTKKLRDEVLVAMQTPVLFVQGSRDTMCPLPLLEEVRRRMTTKNHLLVVESGDHSLVATKSSLRQRGLTQAALDEAICRRIAGFVDDPHAPVPNLDGP